MSFLSSVAKVVRETMLDDGGLPRVSDISDLWFEPQFSKLHDSQTRVTHVAMFIASRSPLFDSSTPDLDHLRALGRELNRFARSKWASREASRAANLMSSDIPTSFLAILEHAPIGAYGARTQQVKAYYDFTEDKIGLLQMRGLLFEEEQVNESVTI